MYFPVSKTTIIFLNVFHCKTVGVLCWGWLSFKKKTNKKPVIPKIPFPSMVLGQDQYTGT